MSHEIRTPMNGIIGMTGAAARHRPDAPSSASSLTMVHASADSLLHIINDILDLSKIEAGRLDASSRSRSSCATQLATALKPLACQGAGEGAGVRRRSVAPDVPDALVGDWPRLRQVLINLVGNAIKFTERGGVASRLDRRTSAPATTALAAFRGQRHRHRHRARAAAADLRGVHAGRRIDDAALRRHRPRADHLDDARRA